MKKLPHIQTTGEMSHCSAGPLLRDSWHGKSRVRVAKVTRRGSYNTFVEFNVHIHLRGGSARSFTDGDNSRVVATDTCKNHVYLLAKTHSCDTPESFALALADRFLRCYDWLTQANVNVTERPWRRAEAGGMEHKHGFLLSADGTRTASVKLTRRSGGAHVAELVSGMNRYGYVSFVLVYS